MSEKFCLKWNNFNSNITKSLSNLRNEEDFYDVTLVGDDYKQISAHKVMLSSCSEYFKEILKQNKHAHPLLCLEGINSNELISILDYLYHGEIMIYQDDLNRFLSIAQRLKLEGLMTEDNNYEGEDPVKDYVVKETENRKIDNDEILEYADVKNIVTFDKKNVILNSDKFQSIEELDTRILELLEKDVDKKWKCRICGRKSQHKSHIKEHVEIHFDGLEFSCPKCNFIALKRNAGGGHFYKHN